MSESRCRYCNIRIVAAGLCNPEPPPDICTECEEAKAIFANIPDGPTKTLTEYELEKQEQDIFK